MKSASSWMNRSLGALPSIFISLCSVSIIELLLGVFTPQSEWVRSVGRVVVAFLAVYTIHQFASVSFARYRPRFKDFVYVQVILILSAGIVWLGVILSNALETYASTSASQWKLSAETLYYAIPFAVGGFLVQSVLGLQHGLIFSLSFAVIVGIYFPNHVDFVPFVLITNLVACLSLSRLRSRSAYLKAGRNVALVAFPLALVSLLTMGDLETSSVALRLLGALLGSMLCAFIASSLTPIVEYVWGYVTDMRLLEMATLDHPLLKELSIQAPGTWNHSMVMGMMVEAAADAIGVNPVLARVGAYFHDIGKMKKPLYFVENQLGSENRHDKLSTSMSALIIRSHVKDGIELARKHKLPAALVDMIPQHHGTSLIEYFYEKACKEAEEAGDGVEVDKSLYTYPGPKPQTREAALLMLADGIEAAARTLSEPSLDRIQGMVQKMINKVFSSGELEECDLTLRDLHLIAKTFTRLLNGIYHQRIAYAEPAEKGADKAQIKEETAEEEKELDGGSAGKKGKTPADERKGKEDSKEDLKRLGM